MQSPVPIVRFATYQDAEVVARLLKMKPDLVWRVIHGRRYTQYVELKIAVLNSPYR